ncbi:hypothetical protein [Bacteroides acidifaciens]|uniref:hypothetical protein n=1 Tax=Bacteroides acidifaciens TaxID=85831 RepID=UPI002557D946|nr:hypothetical protein [Bacteroides acidifaciens]
MRVYVQVKQLGNRKCSIEKIPVDFPVPPVDVQELIEAIVSWQVCEYNERLQQSEVLKYLTQEEVENKATSGKVGFAVNYNGKPAAEVEAITNALQSYEDGIFRIFIDDAEVEDLSSPILLEEDSTLTFIRLAMLSGRLW